MMAAQNYIELVAKTMRTLEVLSQDGGASDLKAVAAGVGLVKSSAYRILFTLKELGYVEQRGRGTYGLTLKTLALLRRSASRPSLTNIARPHLSRLRDALNEAAWLAEWRRGRAIIVSTQETGHSLRLALDIGDVCPLHASALGKAIAAYLPQEELVTALGDGKLPSFTARTLTSRARVLRELSRVREKGYAINDQETIDGAIFVGAPIFDARGRVLAALSVSCPTARSSLEKRAAMIETVRNAAAAISRELAELGFQG